MNHNCIPDWGFGHIKYEILKYWQVKERKEKKNNGREKECIDYYSCNGKWV